MSTLRVTNVQDTAGANSLTTAQIYNGAAKSWVNFNGSGTVAIRASFNVSSITDNGTGDYTVNFTTAMTDANYSVTVMTSRGNTNFDEGAGRNWNTPAATGSCRIWAGTTHGDVQDYPIVDFHLFR